MKRLVVLVALVAVLGMGCAPSGRSSAGRATTDEVPRWLVDSIRKHLDNPSVLRREDVSYSHVWMKPAAQPQVVAVARLDRLNGVIGIYEYTGNGYREVYSKEEPVYELSLIGNERQLVCFVSGFGGTGVQNNFFHVIGYSGCKYEEVWSGVSEASNFTGPLPSTYTTGALRFALGKTHFVYTRNTFQYNSHEFEWHKPSKVQTSTWLYTLDPETNRLKDSTQVR